MQDSFCYRDNTLASASGEHSLEPFQESSHSRGADLGKPAHLQRRWSEQGNPLPFGFAVRGGLRNCRMRTGEVLCADFESIEMVRDLGLRGAFSPDDPRTANSILIPVISAIPQMASVNTGRRGSNAFLLVRRKNEWLSVFMKGGASTAEWHKWTKWGRVLKKWMQEIDFDPRKRPGTRSRGTDPTQAIHWTAPYGFVPTGDPGITAAVRVEVREGRTCLLSICFWRICRSLRRR